VEDSSGYKLRKDEWRTINSVILRGTLANEFNSSLAKKIQYWVPKTDGTPDEKLPSALSFLFPPPDQALSTEISVRTKQMEDCCPVSFPFTGTSLKDRIHMKECIDVMTSKEVRIVAAKHGDDPDTYNKMIQSSKKEDFYAPFSWTKIEASWNILSLLGHHTVRKVKSTTTKETQYVGWVLSQPEVNNRKAKRQSVEDIREEMMVRGGWQVANQAGIVVAPYAVYNVKENDEQEGLHFMLEGRDQEIDCPIATNHSDKTTAVQLSREVFDLLAGLCGCGALNVDERCNFEAFVRNKVLGRQELLVEMIPPGADGKPILDGNGFETCDRTKALCDTNGAFKLPPLKPDEQTKLFGLCIAILEKVYNGLSEIGDWCRLYSILLEISLEASEREIIRNLVPDLDNTRRLRLQTIALFQNYTPTRYLYIEYSLNMRSAPHRGTLHVSFTL
jgi:hypothetical protein